MFRLALTRRLQHQYQIWIFQFKRNQPINNIIVQPVQGDGNCFFRALALIILGNEDHYLVIKEAILNIALKSDKKISDDVKTILTKDNMWATEDVASLTSMVFQIPIFTYGSSGSIRVFTI